MLYCVCGLHEGSLTAEMTMFNFSGVETSVYNCSNKTGIAKKSDNWMFTSRINPNLLSFNCFLRLITIINNNHENENQVDSELLRYGENFHRKMLVFLFISK